MSNPTIRATHTRTNIGKKTENDLKKSHKLSPGFFYLAGGVSECRIILLSTHFNT